MEQSHLIELIKTLSHEEKRQVLQFSALSQFNSGKMRDRVPALLELCFSIQWEDDSQSLEKRKVFESIFPGQSYLEGKLEKVMVEAHKVVRTFLLTQEYLRTENEFYQIFDFSEILRARGLDSRYQQALTKMQKMQLEFPWKNAQYFNRQFLLDKTIHDELSLRNQARGDLNIPVVLDTLEQQFYLNYLTFANRLLLQKKVANLDHSETLNHLSEKINVPNEYLEHSPVLKVNFAIFSFLKKGTLEPSEVRHLFDLLLLHEKNLDPDALREFYTYLRSLSVVVSNQYFDNEVVREMLHELYKDNLDRGYLHYEGKLHPSTYLAVSFAAIRVSKFEWALDFIEKHKHDVAGENESQDLYRLNKALYLFGIGNYSDCLDNIPATSPFVDYLLHGKRLELKALYELRSDLLSYKLDAFRMFLSRTSQKIISASRQQSQSDFANLLHQLSNSKPNDPKRSETILKRLQEKKQAAEWRWLLEKAKELKNT